MSSRAGLSESNWIWGKGLDLSVDYSIDKFTAKCEAGRQAAGSQACSVSSLSASWLLGNEQLSSTKPFQYAISALEPADHEP